MPLPISLEQILSGKTIESERIEYKSGWNPQDIVHTVCAFANDLHNIGGGYIFIGIAEKDGLPVLPPIGLNADQIDAIQKKLVELCNRIYPHYFPIVFPEQYNGKHILILWCPGGDVRPYKAPVSLDNKAGSAYYVRRMSTTVKASGQTELDLLNCTAKVPYDDRINHNASLDDIDVGLIRTFLQQTGSDLYHTAHKLPVEDLCRQLQIARGPDEMLRPINAGLLFFCRNPQKYFTGARIEIVEYNDDIGDSFVEKTFSGPVHLQLVESLNYLKNMHISEYVRKIPGNAKAIRFFNYPYEAIEESLANAVYHRGYDIPNTIEISVRLDRIEILSFPGPVPPVDNKALKNERVVARDYRNRRIGDFLKELSLTEGRGTGIPKIKRACQNNGSPAPIFETDDERTYFLTTIPIHESTMTSRPKRENLKKAESGQSQKAESAISIELRVLTILNNDEYGKVEIAKILGKQKPDGQLNEAIRQLLENRKIEQTIPEKPNSRLQKYKLTNGGKRVLKNQQVNKG